MGHEAWITAVVEEKDVDKAIILAGSLRRVRTARKVVVLMTQSVSKDTRKRLKEAFDSVLLLEQHIPTGWNLKDYAKIHSFSLKMFDKCVYLSPHALVVNNCDEIFEKYDTFAASYNAQQNIDTSVFFFVPKLIDDDAFEKAESSDGNFTNYISAWLKNNIPKIEKLDDKYNFKVDLTGTATGLNSNVSIFNFAGFHPLDIPEQVTGKAAGNQGAVEKFAINHCWKIYMEDVKKFPLNTTQLNYQYKKEPIAVVGMSCRLPGGNNLDEFWSLLAEGRSGIVPLPPHRWTKEHSFFPCKNRKIEGGFLNVPVDEFDSKFFGLSPKEAEFLDPQQRLLLELTWEAFEEALIDPLKLSKTETGVFVGTWVHDYRDIAVHSMDIDFFRGYMGNSLATTAARLSHFLELTGPSIATESGCSSAIAAVDMACRYLRNGDSSLAIAASANLLFHPFEPKSMEYVLAPDYRCKTFDASANGFVRAEGCTVLLLKRFSDAVKDGDNIWGLIRGTALTQEGVSKSLGTPTVHCESLAMEKALKEAGVEAKDVKYVEAHGTGTAVGDPLEIAAIEKVYSRGRTEPLLIGSVKTNVGHTEAAAGMTGMIKVLLSMKNELIPKHLNLNTLNPAINLDAIPAQIPLEPVTWPKSKEKVRIAGVSSFGISGCDGHAIIEEPPELFQPRLELPQERPLHIMKLSTKSKESMDELIKKYLARFNEKIERNEDSEGDFADLAHSANTGRATFNHRAVITARNFSDTVKVLQEKTFLQSDVQSSTSSLCFLFTGQGSQYTNMAKQLYDTSPVFKDSFDKCDHVLQKRYNISIKKILWTDAGGNEELSRTLYSQTSIFVVEYCLLKLWESWGVQPDYVMGHSLGEFAAAVAAGALDFEDALMLVAERSRLIDQLPRGKMLVIKANKNTVDESISAFQKRQANFWVDFAALNSPEQTVVAGDSDMIEQFSKFCGEQSLKTIVLAATHAFHSRHMDPMLEAYRNVAHSVKKPDLGNNRPNFISGMEGKLIDVDSIDSDYWVRHTREKVRYMDACRVIQEEGCTLFLEVGPHPVLSALTMMNMDGHQVSCFPSVRRNVGEWETMLDTLGKLYLSPWKGEIDWKGFDNFYSRKRVSLPFYPFIRKSIWARCKSQRPSIHPLIGKVKPTATNETIFEHRLSLKSVEYIKDHAMGNHVIFPGAGYLEMCLAAGHSTVQALSENMVMPRRPIAIKSFKIASPLGFPESGVCKLQTIVKLKGEEKEDNDEELGYSATVFRYAESEDGSGKWIQHASGKFLPMTGSLPEKLLETVNISEIQSTWEKWNNREDYYDKLPDIGVRFGSHFQNLIRGWKSDQALLGEVKVPQDMNGYLVHPLVSDAMIQAALIWTNKDSTKALRLKVPIHISEFIWLREIPSSVPLFVYCFDDEKGENYCVLLDDTGSPLAIQKGMDFMETNVKLLEGMITQQSIAMPQLWKDVWKRNDGPMQGSLRHQISPELLVQSQEELKKFEPFNNISDDELKFYRTLVKISRYSVLKALYVLGWKPEMKETFSVEGLILTVNIKRAFQEYIQFFLRSMTKTDLPILKAVDEEEKTFRFIGEPPTRDEVEDALRSVSSSSDYTREEYRLMMEIDKSLSEILTGKIHPLSILFSEDPSKPSASKAYKSKNDEQALYIPAAGLRSVRHIEDAERNYAASISSSQSLPVYRILEVGSGTGLSAKAYLDYLAPKSRSTKIEYFFTDVSPAFFTSDIESELKEYEISVVFKKFDMDYDPLEQGLCPEYFDMVLATEVLHAAKNIKKTLRALRSLLKPGGMTAICETICPDERITYTFGLLEGYWQFEDRELRKQHATLTPDMWRDVLAETGFHGISVVPMYNNVHGVISAFAAPQENNFLVMNPYARINSWIIFSEQDDILCRELHKKLANVNRKCIIISKPTEFSETSMMECMKNALTAATEEERNLEGILYLWSLTQDTRDQAKVSLPFVILMKLVADLSQIPRTFAVTRGVSTVESSDVSDPTSGTLVGFCKSLSNENSRVSVTCLDLDPERQVIDQFDELFMNIWVEHKQVAAFRDGLRLRPKLVKGMVMGHEPLTLPSGCDRFQLVLPKTRVISDLEFAYLEPYTLGENDVELEIKALGLNFRDLFTVLKPLPVFERFTSVGIDYAGVVARVGGKVKRFKVGDRVFGLKRDDGLSLPSHFQAPEVDPGPLPDWVTFAEAATFPTAFSTVVLYLVRLAKLKKGETVLVHTASGGVGLMACQICKHYGAKMIATAGSKRKRAYLRSLGIEHVFHSRTTDFKYGILKATGERGVDIVLNTLTGPGFKEASLDVLSQNGRFIEMSKMNVWTKEEVNSLRPDVYYELVDLSQESEPILRSLTKELFNMLEAGSLSPVVYERFDVLNIRGALNYLGKAKHIGKIVCIMPEVKLEKSKLTVSTPLFTEASTYLVTGGLGGIGFEVVKWMLKNGAKHIAIVSRSPPKPEIASQIETWIESQKHVQAFSVDVGNYEQVKTLLENLKNPQLGFPQIRGVMHAAGVLQDALLENQSWDKFLQTYNPKVSGTWNLHDLTKDYILEHFVLFSSIAAKFGSPAQTNHSASNSFEDSFAAYRNSIGLPATSINWGNWGEVGVATEIDFPGLRPISTAQGLLALEMFLRTQTSHMSVLNVESFSLVLKLFPNVRHYVDDLRLFGDIKTTAILMNSDEFWNEVDSAPDRQGKVDCFKKLIKTVVKNILRMDKDDVVDDNAEFQSLGIDSLMVLEMKNGLQNILGGRMVLSATQLKDCNTSKVLAERLVSILEGAGDQIIPSHDELKQLIRDDSNLLSETLSVEHLQAIPIDHVETVLLTGATGNLGPYLLMELTQRTQLKTVYCLIRPSSQLSGMDRLKTKLEEAQLNELVDMSKVEVILGDITSPKFGLSDEVYFNLCEKVHAVIHSAVKSDHTARYWKARESNTSHMRTVNVLGTARLLEFAGERRLKHFFHASTMLTFTGTGNDGQFSDGWQDVSAFDAIQLETAGYPISKHISEQLVHQALVRGMPCKAFRFPHIAGDSKTGRIKYLHNHVMLRWLTCMKLGIIHDIPAPIPMVAVDHCAKISVDIFFNPEAPMDVYNVVQKCLEVEQVLVEVAQSFGIKLEIVSYEEFIEKLKSEDEKSHIAEFVKLYEEKESDVISMFENPPNLALKKYFENESNFLNTNKLAKYAPEYDNLVESSIDVLKRDIAYLKKEGVFEKFGINIS